MSAKERLEIGGRPSLGAAHPGALVTARARHRVPTIRAGATIRSIAEAYGRSALRGPGSVACSPGNGCGRDLLLVGAQKEPEGPGVASSRRRCEPAGRKLDDERSRPRKAVVLPVRRRPVRPANGAIRLARETGVAPSLGAAPAPRAHERLRLVVPDRHVRPDALDQPSGQPRLALGPGPRPGVLGIPAAPDRDPLGAEVAVEVDAASVQADAEPSAVRVQVVDDPQVEPGGRGPCAAAS